MTSPSEEARLELLNLFAGWDWTNYFPTDYNPTLVKGVHVTSDWPSDQTMNIQTTANGMWTKPVVSIMPMILRQAVGGDGAVMGGIMGAGATQGTLRRGQVLAVTFQVDCWADIQTGAGDQVERLGGGVADCVFVNRNSLQAYRRLQISGGRLLMNDPAQLWRYVLNVEGRLVQSYDA